MALATGSFAQSKCPGFQPSDIPRTIDPFLEASLIVRSPLANKSVPLGKLFWQSLDFGVKYAVVKLNTIHF
jgi:hypothetical protein